KGLWLRNGSLALLMAGFLISLAGAPPMAGVWAKVFVFLAALNAEVYWLAVVMGINAVVAAWYYLAVVKRMFLDAPETTDAVQVPWLLRAGMGAAALALVAACFYPALITDLADASTMAPSSEAAPQD
ncbi:MAG: NADH-quinone oxidoreductase subunit N, partial [Actinomycetota bacterium]